MIRQQNTATSSTTFASFPILPSSYLHTEQYTALDSPNSFQELLPRQQHFDGKGRYMRNSVEVIFGHIAVGPEAALLFRFITVCFVLQGLPEIRCPHSAIFVTAELCFLSRFLCVLSRSWPSCKRQGLNCDGAKSAALASCAEAGILSRKVWYQPDSYMAHTCK